MAKRYFETLEANLNEHNFVVDTVNVYGKHIMAQHKINKMWYICHYEDGYSGYKLTDCKRYDSFDGARLKFIRLATEDIH